MKKIYFVTTNNYKFQKCLQALNVQTIELEQLIEETPEIQAANNREIAAFSAEWAANKFNLQVIKEDVGVYIENLQGFPGPYLNYVENCIKSDGFLKLMENISNRNAYWEYAIAYCEPGKKPVSFYTHQKGTIAHKAQGNSGFFIDKIFIPKGETKTTAELLDIKAYHRNNQHYKKLKDYLLTILKDI